MKNPREFYAERAPEALLQNNSQIQEVERTSDRLAAELRENGIAVLPPLFTPEEINEMRRCFEARLSGMQWNDIEGYEMEPQRDVVQNVLTIDQGFIDLAVHPIIGRTLAKYIGPEFALTEAKGWKSLPTKRDFQGWHGDYWYDETKVTGIAK